MLLEINYFAHLSSGDPTCFTLHGTSHLISTQQTPIKCKSLRFNMDLITISSMSFVLICVSAYQVACANPLRGSGQELASCPWLEMLNAAIKGSSWQGLNSAKFSALV